RVAKDRDNLRNIVGMDDSIGAPVPHRLEREAAIFDYPGVDVIHLTARRQDSHESGNAIDDERFTGGGIVGPGRGAAHARWRGLQEARLAVTRKTLQRGGVSR